ncbi:MAG: D-aminoacylase [Candidatus Hydrogenedentota bacterium]|nr:MAG: D-aminoacylase [Candidatus Hydrogenedentota bacterium]
MSDDVLIKNGMVMDGTGQPAVRADVVIRGDRIEDVGLFPDAEAARVIDAAGLAVAPGFIDVHTHLDFFLPSPRHAHVLESWAHQGVTTIVAGNCGMSPAPINHAYEDTVSTYWNFALPHDGLEYEWTTMSEFFDFLERRGQAFNVAVLTGHGILRTNVMGFQARFASSEEVSKMKKMLRESLEAGSIGLSLGLYYVPGIYSHTGEIIEVASVLTDFGAPLVPHTRGMSETYAEAVREVIEVAEEVRIPLHISHHGSFVRDDPSVMERANKAIEEAVERGLEIGHDYIPYATGSTTFLSLYPPEVFDGGLDRFFERLEDPIVRKRIINGWETVVPAWPNWEHSWWTDNHYHNAFSSWSFICLGGFREEKNRRFENMSVEQIAAALDKDPFETVFDLTLEESGKLIVTGGAFDNPMDDEAIARAASDPNCSIASDIVGADHKTINPVAYGTFTKVLGRLARDEGVMTQEEAVRKMTSLPARQMGLKDRGVIRKAALADITIFNPDTVIDRASFGNPYQFSEGIEYVFINGKVVSEKGKYHADALAGRVIRRT